MNNKDEILEKSLGNRMVMLSKEARRVVGRKEEIHSQIVDSLREMFGLLRRSGKSAQDKSA